MNWQAVKFDWNQARAFLVTAESGSFSAAARELRLTQPTLGRQVAALEQELGVTLFERVGRTLALTEAGNGLLKDMREMGEAALRVSLVASGQVQDVSGHVSVSVSDMLAARLMPAVASRLRERAPQVILDIIATNEISDLQRREADIAIRHVVPEHPDLIARKTRPSLARLYASQGYYDRVGLGKSSDALAKADFIAMGDCDEAVRYLNGYGVPIKAENIRLSSGSSVVCWEMVRQGMGVFFMMDDIAAATPGVVSVWPEAKPIHVDNWLTVHRELHTSRRIRLVYDLLAEVLMMRPWPLT